VTHGVGDQIRDAPQPVEQAELGMRVKVREVARSSQLIALPSLTALEYRRWPPPQVVQSMKSHVRRSP